MVSVTRLNSSQEIRTNCSIPGRAADRLSLRRSRLRTGDTDSDFRKTSSRNLKRRNPANNAPLGMVRRVNCVRFLCPTCPTSAQRTQPSATSAAPSARRPRGSPESSPYQRTLGPGPRTLPCAWHRLLAVPCPGAPRRPAKPTSSAARIHPFSTHESHFSLREQYSFAKTDNPRNRGQQIRATSSPRSTVRGRPFPRSCSKHQWRPTHEPR